MNQFMNTDPTTDSIKTVQILNYPKTFSNYLRALSR